MTVSCYVVPALVGMSLLALIVLAIFGIAFAMAYGIIQLKDVVVWVYLKNKLDRLPDWISNIWTYAIATAVIALFLWMCWQMGNDILISKFNIHFCN